MKNYFYALGITMLGAINTFGQSPGGVSGNLQLWLPAENYTGGSQWTDMSSNARNATKIGTVPNTVVYNFYNIPTNLNKSNNFSVAHHTDLNTANGAITIFAVGLPRQTYSPFVSKVSNQYWDSGWLLAASTPMADVGFTTGNWTGAGGTNVAKKTGLSYSQPHIFTAGGNGGGSSNTVSLSNNGNTETTAAATNTVSNTAVRIGADGYAYPTATTSGSDIAEVIIYNTPLSAADKLKVQSYLAIKYGITLSQPQAYNSSDGTMVWNPAVNTNYNRNIFGIAKDDESALNQKISKSINSGTILTLAASRDFVSLNTLEDRPGIADDNTFLLMGDNGNTNTALINNGCRNDIQRKWLVQPNGSSFESNLQVDLSTYPAIGGNVVMLVSDTENFTTYDMVTLDSSEGKKFNFVYEFTSNKYITFSSLALSAPSVTGYLVISCGSSFVDLSAAHGGSVPSGTNLLWFTNNEHSGTPLTGAQVTEATAGIYYAFYYETATGCWSPASSIVTIGKESGCCNAGIVQVSLNGNTLTNQ